MDDLICPECGRPNLAEARKCWYCQTELVRLEANQSNLSEPVSKHPASTRNDTAEEPPDVAHEEDIPDWLVKIRNKIKEEQGPQEELPYWKQKDIFGGEKELKRKPPKEKKTHKALGQPDENSSRELAADTRPSADEDLSAHDGDNENLSDELPDGFTKL
jgi:hypothetical protein